MLTDEEIRGCLSDYGVDVEAARCGQIRTYIDLLLKWNRSISLTTVTDEAQILRFHFGESVFALSVVDSMNGRLADVGAGAGFPGLPLRIFNDRIELVLIESNARKCAFLNEVVRQINLPGTRVIRARYEDASELSQGLDFIVSRALGGYEKLLRWAAGALTPAGRLVLWLGEEDAQKLASLEGWSWQPKIQIPGSLRRFLLVGSIVRAKE
jgi:16S rRNA (guanine527-N7)-methyltransferase